MDAVDYELISKYYDVAYKNLPGLIDVPFYVDIAQRHGGPVLEVACGTGRILLEIARLGMTIEGVDYSEDMLSILEGKLHNETEELQQRVTLHRGDMRTFSLKKQFRLVIMPFRSLQHMYTVDDQIQALERMRQHLNPSDGLLVFNVFYPNFTMLEKDMHREILEIEWQDPNNAKRKVKRFFTREKVDKLNQYFEGFFTFKTYENTELIMEEKAPIKMGFFTYPQMQLLFTHCGLEIVEEFGSFMKEPIDVLKEMIFLVRRKAQERR